eukprot:scaffold188_cov336-Pavlova_lutheri.AAC.6
MFGKLEGLWQLVGDKTQKTVLLLQTSKEDVVAALLNNFHTCLCGGVTTEYLEIAPPTLQEYATMIEEHASGNFDNPARAILNETSSLDVDASC